MNNERLTHERANGIKAGYWSPETKEVLIQRLAQYENTGCTPEEVRELKEFKFRHDDRFQTFSPD